ncbi:MAG: hypothetical protein KKD92_06670, partial [Proteobacteria bacterium]|nr:hypothetical protein [Pseudomonadota bacterium]
MIADWGNPLVLSVFGSAAVSGGRPADLDILFISNKRGTGRRCATVFEEGFWIDVEIQDKHFVNELCNNYQWWTDN